MTLKEKIKAEFPFRIELHCHTKPSSPCGDFSVTEMLDIYKNAGYDAILLTNHYLIRQNQDWDNDTSFFDFYFKDYENGIKYAEKTGMKLYLGAELRFTENGGNDYLFIGTDRKSLEQIFPYLSGSEEDFYVSGKPENSLIIQAHPYRKNCTPTNPEYLDGIEIINAHPNHNNSNSYAARLAKENPKLLKTCGTDFHHAGMNSLTSMRFSVLPNDSFELAQLIKNKNYVMEFGDSIVLP